jgi:multiple sugar transport system permease protein
MALPLVWMITMSLSPPGQLTQSLWPREVTLENYREVLKVIPFWRFYFNSFFIAATVTLGQVITSALAAYAFARLEFRGRNVLFFGYLATMMIPGAVTLIPRFILFQKAPQLLNTLFGTSYFTADLYFMGEIFAGKAIGLDSYFALIAPALFSAYGVFLLRQFFLGISHELEEAAALDGLGKLGTWWHIILPLSRPALATLAIFTFMGNWRNFLWPLIMTNSDEMRTLPIGLAQFQGMYQTDYNLLMAGSLMMILPMIIVFIAGQRYFVKGIQMGAVKG